MSYAKFRQMIYADIERELQNRRLFMCPKCKFYINEISNFTLCPFLRTKCTQEICVNKVRRSVCNENSKNKNIRVKRSRIQSKN